MIKPTEDRVLVQEVEQEQIRESGLYVPTKALERNVKHGKVVAVGPGRLVDNANPQYTPEDGEVDYSYTVEPLRYKMSVMVGHQVMFNSKAGVPVTVDGVDYLLMSEYEILATV